MPKRFIDSELMDQDWFIDLPDQVGKFYIYLFLKCDHAGIWKPEQKKTDFIIGKHIDFDSALDLINAEKIRIIKLDNGRWFIVDFIVFQYGEKLNLNNRVHLSIHNLLSNNKIKMTSIRGLIEVTEGVKEKDKVKDSFKRGERGEINAPIPVNHTKADVAALEQLDKHGKKTSKSTINYIKDRKLMDEIELKRKIS